MAQQVCSQPSYKVVGGITVLPQTQNSINGEPREKNEAEFK